MDEDEEEAVDALVNMRADGAAFTIHSAAGCGSPRAGSGRGTPGKDMHPKAIAAASAQLAFDMAMDALDDDNGCVYFISLFRDATAPLTEVCNRFAARAGSSAPGSMGSHTIAAANALLKHLQAFASAGDILSATYAGVKKDQREGLCGAELALLRKVRAEAPSAAEVVVRGYSDAALALFELHFAFLTMKAGVNLDVVEGMKKACEAGAEVDEEVFKKAIADVKEAGRAEAVKLVLLPDEEKDVTFVTRLCDVWYAWYVFLLQGGLKGRILAL